MYYTADQEKDSQQIGQEAGKEIRVILGDGAGLICSTPAKTH